MRAMAPAMTDRARRLFVPILAGASLRDRFFACVGALIGLALTAWIGMALGMTPYIVAPLGASAVLVFAVPASPLAQPWPVVGGNALSALTGVATAHILGTSPIAAAIAVGAAILVMSLTRSLHPPGGAAALTGVIGGPAVAAAGFTFPLAPVAINSAVLVAAGIAYHRLSGHSYPHRAPTPAGAGFHAESIDRALADLGETLDVDRGDLDLLLARAEVHEKTRRQSAKSSTGVSRKRLSA